MADLKQEKDILAKKVSILMKRFETSPVGS
jgi:hypothetical protein